MGFRNISAVLVLCCACVFAGASDARAVSTYVEDGPYFVRARYVTIPLRTDLNWFLFNRNQVGMLRYPAKIYYPAKDDVKREEGQPSIYFPPDTSGAPYPALIFVQGANTPIETYSWLMEHIAGYGYIVIGVTEFMVSSGNMEGQYQNLFPFGIADPETWLSSMTIADAVSYLESINQSKRDPLPSMIKGLPDRWVVRNPRNPDNNTRQSLFHGMVDTENIILAGHSFGGFLALMSSNTRITKPPRPGVLPKTGFADNVKGCILYGVHTFAESGTGYPSAINVPLLDIGGEKDGVASGALPDDPDASGYDRIKYTFENYIPASDDNSRHLLIIKGANHLSIAAGPDPTVDRSFWDQKEGIISRIVAHDIIKEKTTAFLEYYIRGEASAKTVLDAAAEDPYILEYTTR